MASAKPFMASMYEAGPQMLTADGLLGDPWIEGEVVGLTTVHVSGTAFPGARSVRAGAPEDPVPGWNRGVQPGELPPPPRLLGLQLTHTCSGVNPEASTCSAQQAQLGVYGCGHQLQSRRPWAAASRCSGTPPRL
jgi:hypothetical protein